MVHTNYCSKMISSIQNTSFVDFCSSFFWSFAFVLIKNISKNQHHKTGNLWEVNILFVENLLLLMLASKEASFTDTLHEDHEKSPLNEIRKHIMCGILKKCAPSTINRMIYVKFLMSFKKTISNFTLKEQIISESSVFFGVSQMHHFDYCELLPQYAAFPIQES